MRTSDSSSLRAPVAVAAAIAILAFPAPAIAGGTGLLESAAADPGLSSAPGSVPTRLDSIRRPGPRGPGRTPTGLELTSAEAIAIAKKDQMYAEALAEYGKLDAVAQAKPPDTWQIGFFTEDEEVVQVLVNDPTGTVRESWSGIQVAWQMARGYPGAFGRSLNAPWIWLPLCALFVFGLFDFRRWRRIAHLDLIVLTAGFGASHVFFNAARIEPAVWLYYPPLLYLLGRMLWIGFRGLGAGLRPTLPVRWMAVAALVLVAFRVGLNVADSNAIDVGYAGVIGADRIAHGEPIWGNFPEDNRFGDTYGPAAYYTYVPFEAVLGWEGRWDELPAAHAAALFFDLACVVLLFGLGRRLRPEAEGRALGVMLAFAWLAYPYTAFALNSNANDSLVGALALAALYLIVPRPERAGTSGESERRAGLRHAIRGAFASAAALTKFAPAALLPLLATGTRGLADRPPARAIISFATGAGAFAAILLAQALIDPGLSTFWDRTIASQIDRTSPFSLWGQVDLEWLQWVVKGAVAALAVAVAFVPRRRGPVQVAALAAAVLIAVQLFAEHWFYLYLPWFFGAVVVAVGTARRSEPQAS